MRRHLGRVPDWRMIMRFARRAWLGILLCAAAVSLYAQTPLECVQIASNGKEMVVTLDSPLPGTAILNAAPCCPLSIPVSGTAVVGQTLFDLYFGIDTSGSTMQCSGSDINEDGWLCGPGDSILDAEVKAVRDFVDTLDPTQFRVAIIQFSMPEGFPPGGRQRIVQSLTDDFSLVHDALDEILQFGPSGATDYGGGLQLIRTEFLTNGDPVLREQIAYFMSDGNPTYPIDPFLSEQPGDSKWAIDNGDLLVQDGIEINTFAVGLIPTPTLDPVSPPRCLGPSGTDVSTLECLALRSGGEYFESSDPADIVDQLQAAVPDLGIAGITVSNATNGESVMAPLSLDGTWSAEVPIATNVLNLIHVEALAEDGTRCDLDTDFLSACVASSQPGAPPCHCTALTQGFWKRQCKGPHPSGEHDSLPEYVETLSETATFAELADVEAICSELSPDPRHDKCEQARAQLMAAELNLVSGLAADCCVVAEDGATDSADFLDGLDELLSGSGDERAVCVDVQDWADLFNNEAIWCEVSDMP